MKTNTALKAFTCVVLCLATFTCTKLASAQQNKTAQDYTIRLPRKGVGGINTDGTHTRSVIFTYSAGNSPVATLPGENETEPKMYFHPGGPAVQGVPNASYKKLVEIIRSRIIEHDIRAKAFSSVFSNKGKEKASDVFAQFSGFPGIEDNLSSASMDSPIWLQNIAATIQVKP